MARYFHAQNLTSVEIARDENGQDDQEDSFLDDENFINKIDVTKYKRYSRVNRASSNKPHLNIKLQNNQLKAANAATRAALHDNFNTQSDIGSIEVEDDETTLAIGQDQILAQSGLSTKNKRFELYLPQNGPYFASYSPGGKQLLLCGQMGHVANFTWKAKQLTSEINVAERIRDCCWLQNDTMFAVAQKRYSYVYDKKGVELHCLKRLDFMEYIDFMPYHLLLFGVNDLNYLSYFDVSVGKLVSSNKAYSNKTLTIAQNKSTGVTYLGHTNGVVTLWSPNSDKPLASILCQRAALSAMCISNDGNTLATASKDKQLSFYDTRTFKCLQKMQMREFVEPIACLEFSQTNMLACSSKSDLKIFKPNAENQGKYAGFLQHKSPSVIRSLEFCPFEDILGIGHHMGFESIIIPGAGNVNYDTNEANPVESKKHRRNQEIRRMIEKVNHEMIDPEVGAIGKINVNSLREDIIQRNNVKHLKQKSIQIGKLKNKSRGKGSDSSKESRRRSIFGQKLKEKIKTTKLSSKQLEHVDNEITKSKPSETDPLFIFK